MKKASVNLFTGQRYRLSDGRYKIKVRVTYNRKSKYYDTGIKLYEKEYKSIMSKRTKKELHGIRDLLRTQELDMQKLASDIVPFSFEAFDRAYSRSDEKSNTEVVTVMTFCSEHIERLRQENRVGTAASYENGLKAFIRCFGESARFQDLTRSELPKLESYLRKEGISPTTIGIYMRAIRAMYNAAIREGIVSKDLYPFEGYRIPTGRNIKKALTKDEVQKIVAYKGETEQESLYLDYWLFLYYCHGLNVMDMALMEWKHVHSDRFVFFRAKTIRQKNSKQIVILISDKVRVIMDRRANANTSKYVFSILRKGANAEDIRRDVKNLTKQINKYMRRISQKIGVDKDVTTYTARHTFATILKRAGAPISYISDAMGHTNVATTENYLDSFDDETRKRWTDEL